MLPVLQVTRPSANNFEVEAYAEAVKLVVEALGKIEGVVEVATKKPAMRDEVAAFRLPLQLLKVKVWSAEREAKFKVPFMKGPSSPLEKS